MPNYTNVESENLQHQSNASTKIEWIFTFAKMAGRQDSNKACANPM